MNKTESYLSYHEFSYLKKLILLLKEKDKSKIFYDMVDAYQYPNYYVIIENPMCFKLILSKLNNFIYSNMIEFKHDLDLIWDNCRKFNKEDSPIYYLSITLQEISSSYLNSYEVKLKKEAKEWLNLKEDNDFLEEDSYMNKVLELYDKLTLLKRPKVTKLITFIRLNFPCCVTQETKRNNLHSLNLYKLSLEDLNKILDLRW